MQDTMPATATVYQIFADRPGDRISTGQLYDGFLRNAKGADGQQARIKHRTRSIIHSLLVQGRIRRVAKGVYCLQDPPRAPEPPRKELICRFGPLPGEGLRPKAP